MKPLFFFSFLLFSGILHASEIQPSQDFDTIRKGVVQIKVYSQGVDPYSPWQMTPLRASTGTGFLIGKTQILTNAHVISNAKYIQVQRHNQTVWYEVEIQHVAHDCDLAVLKAKNPEFYNDSHIFELGGIPDLNSPIMVVGYPIGGDKISVSRGIVSRKEQSTYAHSQVDSHLVIQVDAAINPGNSGGPAIQGNKVVGVAFQVAARGENIGYLIPTTVIKYFLTDIVDGKYDGYVELGTRTMNSFNSSLRKYRNIPENLDGVFVTKVLRGGSAEGFLQANDLLLEIDGLPIGRNGTVLLDKDARVDFVEVVDNKHSGEPIRFKVYRDDKQIDVTFPAKKMKQIEFMRHKYDESFPYYIFGGMVFQPVSRDILQEWSRHTETQGGSQFLYRFFYFMEDDLGAGKSDEDIVFYRRLNHSVNAGASSYQNLILESINGIQVRSIKHLKEICEGVQTGFLKFKFKDMPSSFIIKKNDAVKADSEISEIYKIGKIK